MVRYGGGEGGEEKSGEERDREKGGNIAPRPSDGAKPRYTADRLGWVIFFCSFSFVGKCSVKMGWERGGGGYILAMHENDTSRRTHTRPCNLFYPTSSFLH